MTFRSTSYQETLQQAGVPENIARAHAKALEENVIDEVVTRDHLDKTLDARLAEMKFELVKWIVGSVGAATLTILAAILRFAR